MASRLGGGGRKRSRKSGSRLVRGLGRKRIRYSASTLGDGGRKRSR